MKAWEYRNLEAWTYRSALKSSMKRASRNVRMRKLGLRAILETASMSLDLLDLLLGVESGVIKIPWFLTYP